MSTYCETESCNNEAEYWDEMDNQLCEEHMKQDIEETGNDASYYEKIDWETNGGATSPLQHGVSCVDCDANIPTIFEEYQYIDRSGITDIADSRLIKPLCKKCCEKRIAEHEKSN